MDDDKIFDLSNSSYSHVFLLILSYHLTHVHTDKKGGVYDIYFIYIQFLHVMSWHSVKI